MIDYIALTKAAMAKDMPLDLPKVFQTMGAAEFLIAEYGLSQEKALDIAEQAFQEFWAERKQ